MKAIYAPMALAAAFALAACSSSEDAGDAVNNSASGQTTASTSPAGNPTRLATPSATAPEGKDILSLEGFDDLAVGQPVPTNSSFKLTGAQASDTCLVYSSPEHQGTYAIVEDGDVRRITVARDSSIKLIEGIGVGSIEKDVLAAFPGFRAEPHKYVEPPAKYLTQPGSDPRLRFEIGEDSKVTAIHVGMTPQLLYVEGCA